MREFAKVSPQFWINAEGKKIRRLGIHAQLVSFYLLTNPHANMIGVYYLPITFISHELGISIEDANKALHSLCASSFCTYDNDLEYIWVHEMAATQVGIKLKAADNRVKAIHDVVASLPKLCFLPKFFDKYFEAFVFPSHFRPNSKSLQSKERGEAETKEVERETSFMSGKPDVPPLNKSDLINKTDESLKSQAIEILEFLNIKTERVYRPVDANLKLIISRLKSGASVQDCRSVIAKKTREWRKDTKMSEYLRPATLFNAIKFEQYMGELVLPKDELNEFN